MAAVWGSFYGCVYTSVKKILLEEYLILVTLFSSSELLQYSAHVHAHMHDVVPDEIRLLPRCSLWWWATIQTSHLQLGREWLSLSFLHYLFMCRWFFTDFYSYILSFCSALFDRTDFSLCESKERRSKIRYFIRVLSVDLLVYLCRGRLGKVKKCATCLKWKNK